VGKMQRNKGRRAESAFKLELGNRDWIVADLSAGCKDADLIATDPAGRRWICEVKDHKLLKPDEWRKQAQTQAAKHKSPWLLAYHVPGYAGLWVVERQGERPVIWGAV
jgi:hypothetical protein